MTDRRLHIAWLGPAPAESGGVQGVATELLDGLAGLGHRIDCFFPGSRKQLPARLENNPRLKFLWAGGGWTWGRWYSRTPVVTFISGLGHRAIAFRRLRSSIARCHAVDPYDVVYQFSTIETFGVPRGLAGSVPLVIHPSTHMAGELRWLIAERRLGRKCQPWHRIALVALVVAVRTAVQRLTIHRASLLICKSGVFRDHLVNDYGFPSTATVVVPNTVRMERFGEAKDGIGQPPTAVVVTRIAVRKGIDQIVVLSQLLKERDVEVRLRIVGGQSQHSDYRPLLGALEPSNSTYLGHLDGDEIPRELVRSDMFIQASKYEPFGSTVAEALATGLPVIATSEVGALEGLSASSFVETPVGDPEALADAVVTTLERLRADAEGVRTTARADAHRLFSADVVCQRISEALEALPPANRNGGPVRIQVRGHDRLDKCDRATTNE